MAFVPGFKYDIFLSYARETDDGGYVGALVTQLTEFLTQELGRDFREQGCILFDQESLNVAPNDWQATLQQAGASSALYMPLLSPNYVTSRVCAREWDDFRNQGNLDWPAGETSVYRICPVTCWPVSRDLLEQVAPEIRRAQQIVGLSDDSSELPRPGTRAWRSCVDQLGRFLANGLRTMRRSKQTVFLGETPIGAADDAKKKIKAQLSRLGFRVIPESPQAYSQPDLMKELLAGAHLAVHFAGGQTEDRPYEAISDSLTECRGLTIVYQVRDLTPAEKVYREMFSNEQCQAPPEKRSLKWRDYTLEELLADLREQFKKDNLDPSAVIGIACEGEDSDEAALIAREIQERTGLRAACHGLRLMELRKGRGWLYYWGAAPGRRLLQSRKISQGCVVAWYLAPPPKQRTDDLTGVTVVCGGSSFQIEELRPFLEQFGWNGTPAQPASRSVNAVR